MDRIADYQGTLLNHVETLYRPGERDIVIRLAEALGCAISDTGFKGDGTETFLAGHPNPDDRDMQSNAFYMSPMRPEQQPMETCLKRLAEEDGDLAATLAGYRTSARKVPFGIPHFALRYPGPDAIRQAAEALKPLEDLLGDRINIRIFWPTDPDVAVGRLVQGFVYQDVIVSGSFLHGQLIELQSEAA